MPRTRIEAYRLDDQIRFNVGGNHDAAVIRPHGEAFEVSYGYLGKRLQFFATEAEAVNWIRRNAAMIARSD